MNPQEPKTARIDARMPEAIHLLLQKAAALQGRTISDFVVSSARDAAEAAIAKHEIIQLSMSDQERFVAAIRQPVPISEAMVKAATNHDRMIEPS